MIFHFKEKLNNTKHLLQLKNLNTLTTGIFTYDVNDKNLDDKQEHRNKYSSCARKQH